MDYYEKKRNSAIRKYFLREEKWQTAICEYTDCKWIVTIGSGSTKDLHTHLLSVHKINFTTASTSAKTLGPGEPLTKKSKTLIKHFSMLGEKKNYFLQHLHD